MKPISFKFPPSMRATLRSIVRKSAEKKPSDAGIVEAAIELASAKPGHYSPGPRLVRISDEHRKLLKKKAAAAGVSMAAIIDNGLVRLERRMKDPPEMKRGRARRGGL